MAQCQFSVIMSSHQPGCQPVQSAEYIKYAKIFSDYFWLIFIPTENLGNPLLLILCPLKILVTHSCWFYDYWRFWWLILADFMPTEDLCESTATNSCCICCCFIPISKNHRSCYVQKSIILVSLQYPQCIVPKSFVLVSFQFSKCIILVTIQNTSLLFHSKIDHLFLASLWFDYIQHIT